MGENRKVPSRKWTEYIVEFVVILFGIMFSFILNEWRLTRNARANEIGILEEIRMDLKVDSTEMAKQMVFFKTAIKAYGQLITADENYSAIPKDTLDLNIDLLVSYKVFPSQQKGYEKLKASDNLSELLKDELVPEIVDLYNSQYTLIKEWTYIDKVFVLETMIPFLNANAPFILPPNQKYLYDSEILKEMKNKDHFKNLVKTGLVYKQTSHGVYQHNIEQLGKVIATIDAFLADNQ
ncbi:MAG: hypothetical protein AAFX87_08695 [Bacteroidota bacterium]